MIIAIVDPPSSSCTVPRTAPGSPAPLRSSHVLFGSGTAAQSVSLCTSWSSTRLSAVVLSASLSAWSVLLSFSFSHFPFRLHICNRCQSYTSVLGVSVHIAPLSKAQRDHLATIAYVTLMCSSSVRPDYRTRLQRYDEQIVFCKFFRNLFSHFHIFTFPRIAVSSIFAHNNYII